MVGVIVLYDHIHPGEEFDKTSKVDMKYCFKVPKDQSSNRVEGRLSALRYTTKHLSGETTSTEIRSPLQYSKPLLQMEQCFSVAENAVFSDLPLNLLMPGFLSFLRSSSHFSNHVLVLQTSFLCQNQ